MSRILGPGRLAMVLAMFALCGATAVFGSEDPLRTADMFFKRSIRLETTAADMVVPEARDAYRNLLVEAREQWEQTHPDMPFDIWVKGFDFSGLKFRQSSNDGQTAVVDVSGEYSVQAGGAVTTRPVDLDILLRNTDDGWQVSRP